MSLVIAALVSCAESPETGVVFSCVGSIAIPEMEPLGSD